MGSTDRNTQNRQHLEILPHYPFVTRTLIDLFLSGELPNVQEITIEPEYGYAGRIVYHNGSVHMFRSTNVGLNNLGATEVARDKGYTKYFLNVLGYKTPAGKVFLLRDYIDKIDKNLSRYGFSSYADVESMYDYISSTIGYPCFIKPNAGSQGRGISKCYDEIDVEFVVSEYRKNRVNVLIVEESVNLPDYRIVVLKDQVISCYLRKPLQCTGDGVSTIKELLLLKQAMFVQEGRDTLLNIEDPRIARKLARSNYNLETILMPGEICLLYDVSNLSAGGEAEDCTDRICQYWKDFCIKLVADMGLVFCGVDIACSDLEDAHAAYSILEINASPGLDNYAASGVQQAATVRNLYRRVFNDIHLKLSPT